MVLDESSSFKNSRAKRFRALKLVRGRISRLVELTGTPAPNGMEDLWAQIFLLDGGVRLGRTLTSFRETFFKQEKGYPGQPYRTYSLVQDGGKRIREAISDICLSMKAEDYLTLPPYVEDVVPVVLDSKARRAYDKMERDMLLEVDDAQITAGSAAVLNGKLLQLCSGAVYDTEGNAVPIHECKIEAFLETVEQLHGEHVLVFYWFQHDKTRLLEALENSGKRDGRRLRVRVFNGVQEERDWNAGEIDILLAHPASTAYGLNLQQGGHHVIWFSYPNWTLELYQQANARLHRQGQQFPVISHLLVVQGGVDVDVVAALNSKGDEQEALMQSLKARIRSAKGAIK